MDIILDTHIVIWALDDDPRLSKQARSIIEDENNNIYFSAISVMEVSIKHLKNKLAMPRSGKDFYNQCLEAGYFTLPFKPKHAILLDEIKNEFHKDPFDRTLIAQAKQEKMFLVTHDEKIINYDEPCIIKV